MCSDWLETTVGELCASNGGSIQTGPFGSQLHAHDYVHNGPVPVVPTSAVGRRHIRAEKLPRIAREKADSLARHFLLAGDIVFARRGVQATGLSALVESEHEGWLCGTGIIRLRLPSEYVDAEFLSFVLAETRSYRWLRQHAIGATMPNLNEEIICRMPLLLPPLKEQRRIAAILGALDDKIELNRKMSRTLEEIAQAIFKSWFIDFDGHVDLVDSELGPIPRGWEVSPFESYAELVKQRVPATPDKDAEKYVALDDMPSKSLDLSKYRPGSAVNSSIIRFQRGDILFGSMRPYFHKVGLAQFDGITRTTTFVLRPRNIELTHFLLLHFASDVVIQFSTDSSVGTTIPYIKWDALGRYRIAVPPEPVLEDFEKILRPMLDRIAATGQESRTLAELRDTLLPKLISGEIRVPEVEEAVEEAVSLP